MRHATAFPPPLLQMWDRRMLSSDPRALSRNKPVGTMLGHTGEWEGTVGAC